MEKVPYLYRPIAMYGGKVLKCCGIATEISRAIVSDQSVGLGLVKDDALMTSEYKGDRIYAESLEPFIAGSLQPFVEQAA
jgi:hypothetical protein